MSSPMLPVSSIRAAVTGTAGWEAWGLFALIFVWTPPHFWALSLLTKDEYGRAGVPMLPNVRGNEEAGRQIFAYSVLLAVTAPLVALLPLAGWLYAGLAVVLGVEFVRRAWNLKKLDDRKNAASLFRFSISYLFVLFAALLIEHWSGLHG